MANNNQLEGYSHPIYTTTHECRFTKVQGPTSTLAFAHFRSRNKVIVRAVHAIVVSICSAGGGSLGVQRDTTSLTFRTLVSANSLGATGNSVCMTLTSSNTLNTITEVMSLVVTGAADRGKWDVIWEYDVVYPATKIGS